jgi:glutathione S-transferase
MTEEALEPYWDPLADRQLLSLIMDVGTFLVSANYQHWAGLKQIEENRLGFDPAVQNLRRVQTCLSWIEERSETWLWGDEPNICDYALACILLWSDSRRPFDWRHNTNIAIIVDKLKERPSFAETAPPPWEN